VEKKRKKCILVWGRIHPGETCGSHMLNGLLNYLCSDKEDARELRRQAIWKVIPMLNPDGVVAGNFRTNLCGRDLNRQFKAQNTFLLP
jgi:murein tripeptide amidase MpaA